MLPPVDGSNLELTYQRYSRLVGVADSISFRHQPVTLFRALAPRLHSIVPFDFINFAIHDPQLQKMHLYLWDGGEWPSKPYAVAPDEAVAGWVWQHQKIFSIDELASETRFEPGLVCIKYRHIQSYCVVPLSTPNEKVGALGFGSKRSHAFSPHDVSFLQRVAQMVALCLDTSVAQVALSLAPLFSSPSVGSATEARWPGNKPFSSRDLELLKQIAAALVPLVERAPDLRPPDTPSGNQQYPAGAHSLLLAPSVALRRAPATTAHTFVPPDSSKHTSGYSAFTASVPQFSDHSEWKELLSIYSDASQVGLALLDSDLRYVMVNAQLAEMNGKTVHDHLGKTLLEILGDSSGSVEACVRSVLTTGKSIRNRDLSFKLPATDAIRHWVTNYVPIRDDSGRVTQVGAVVVETTNQVELERSLHGLSQDLKFEKKRSQVISDVASLMNSKLEMRQAFPRVSSYLRRVLFQEYAELSLHEKKTGNLLRQTIDFPFQRLPHSTEKLDPLTDSSPMPLHVSTPRILSKEELSSYKTARSQYLLAEGIQSLCCIPLLRPCGPLGVLVLGSTRATAFRQEHLPLLNQVAAQLAIAIENEAAARQLEDLKRRLHRETLRPTDEAQTSVSGIIGKSPGLRKVLDRVAIVATTDATVLLLGETGTGKGLIARALHDASKRRNKSFISLNCAAIPTGLLESELFGHEKGAFTGAVRHKVGRVELAHEGTLFLDEIGDIPAELQPKLLRFLQDYEFERLGGNKTIKVNLRLISATNRDLAESLQNKTFRPDLFYRLNVFPIRMPALRERREDIPSLVEFFVHRFSNRMDRTIDTIPSEIMQALVNFDWPGNVRELENFIERSVILTQGSSLQAPLAELHTDNPSTADASLDYADREHILSVLRECGGVISGSSGAAQRLGLKRSTLQSKMRRLGIEPIDYSPSDKKTD